MKKIISSVFFLSFILLIGFQAVCYAGPFQKLKRGASDVLAFPLEIPKHMINATTQASPEWAAAFYGIFYGIPKGLGFGLARGVSGLLDIVTFPLNIPKGWGSLFHMGPFSFGETKESILQDRS